MKRVYLFCNAGMSTSLLASRMQSVADTHNLPIEVKAFSDSKMEAIVNEFNPDVILLGPQVKYRLEPTIEKFGHLGIPIEVISLEDYGNVDGERVLKRSILLMKENKK
ncbi:PTS sugar transporter subunit IIB [Erysipelothrix sp. HDW6B]|uniref:PTS sugar transporter subunit IIB n=1 Tax=Erysipelothrix TaxID=1647 RepID=UPI001356D04D|nr:MULTISPECIES: PTS sugar transporter subunit IIB [Erysipelothrix]QIK86308.1 PTS sugar transporter subunit IIB [Erysipelothrix sp. HDW6B]